MVTLHPSLEALSSSCSMLAMQGIVPSMLDLSQQLQLHLERFCQHLRTQGYPDAEIRALQRLLCCVIDQQASQSLSAQGLNWQSLRLSRSLPEEATFTPQHAEQLLASRHDEIKLSAQLLFALSPTHLPGSRALQPTPPPAAPQPVALAAPVEETPARPEQEPAEWRPVVRQSLLSVLLLASLWLGCRLLLNQGG